jgi:two-component system, sensor histidine kinase and response regulator
LIWLIAEDETDIRNLVAIMAQAWGHTPMPFESGQKAWDWLDEVESGRYNETLPDFALMDIRMPGKRGDEVAGRIRTLERLKHIPIVLMTAFVLTEEDRSKMMAESGVDYIINKPLPDFDKLRRTLHDIIEKKVASNH